MHDENKTILDYLWAFSHIKLPLYSQHLDKAVYSVEGLLTHLSSWK